MNRALLRVLAGAAFFAWVMAAAWVMTRVWTMPLSVALFTVASFTAWILTLVWAMKQDDGPYFRHFHLIAFLLGTAFFVLSESLGIRLGKYQYHPDFKFVVPFLGGVPDEHDPVLKFLEKLASLVGSGVGIPGCKQLSWDVPFALVALEAVFVFGFVRIALTRIRSVGVAAAFAAAGLNALLIVNLDAILDPVLTTSQWCGPEPDPNYHGLDIGLWHWFTNGTHPGYWFGVPLVNYFSWFVAVASISFFLRLDSGPNGLLRRHTHWLKYVWSVLVALVVLFVIQVPFKLFLDWVLLHGQDYLFEPHAVINKKVWHFGLLGLLVGGAILVVRRFGKFDDTRAVDWVSVRAHAFVFAICLVALWFSSSPPFKSRLWWVWLITVVIASTVEFWPLWVRFFAWLRALLKL